MNIDDFHSSLAPLYSTYNKSIKPLVADIETRYQKFPTPLFNEIRAFNDHIARCYLPNQTNIVIANEVKKAEGHLKRIILDCYKYLIAYLHEETTKFEKRTRNIDLTKVDNGEFYPAFRKLKLEAKKQVRAAKVEESQKTISSFKLFEDAYNLYIGIEEMIIQIDAKVNTLRLLYPTKKTDQINFTGGTTIFRHKS